MKLGIRKPSLKKSLKARTTGAIKRKVKKAINPLYGKKGMGLINNPKKAVYNKVYSATTVDSLSGLRPSGEESRKKSTRSSKPINTQNVEARPIDTPVSQLAKIAGSTGKAVLFSDRVIIEKRPFLKKTITTIVISELVSVDFRYYNKSTKTRGFIRFLSKDTPIISYTGDDIFTDLFTVVCSDKIYDDSITSLCKALESIGISPTEVQIE